MTQLEKDQKIEMAAMHARINLVRIAEIFFEVGPILRMLTKKKRWWMPKKIHDAIVKILSVLDNVFGTEEQ